jgi:hypothetical protein
MSDIRCVVCSEPWSADYGNMFPWEVKLFRAGAGCPYCEGESDGYQPQTIFDIENSDDDPMLRLIAAVKVADGTKPEWKRPEDTMHWKCDGCGVQIITDVDTDELEYRVPYASMARHWYHSHPFNSNKPEKKTPAHRFEIAKDTYRNVCELCLSHCSECNAELCENLELESYDEGYAFVSPRDDSKHVCGDCLSEVEVEEAERVWRECYSSSERIDYIKKHRSQFHFQNLPNMMACIRGKLFLGDVSSILY